MKKILFISLLLLNMVLSETKSQPISDILYFKDGTIVRGFIIEQVFGEYVEIEVDNKVVRYKINDINKITRGCK